MNTSSASSLPQPFMGTKISCLATTLEPSEFPEDQRGTTSLWWNPWLFSDYEPCAIILCVTYSPALNSPFASAWRPGFCDFREPSPRCALERVTQSMISPIWEMEVLCLTPQQENTASPWVRNTAKALPSNPGSTLASAGDF